MAGIWEIWLGFGMDFEDLAGILEIGLGFGRFGWELGDVAVIVGLGEAAQANDRLTID